MSDIVKSSWSGGKDSTCAALIHLDLGHIVKAVCYTPMFTHDIPLIGKEHYEFILDAAERLRTLGAEVHIVSGMTYYDYVTHIAKRGKNKGRIFGFPYIGRGMCGFKRDSKLKALFGCDVGEYDYEDIGIAADEVKRQRQLSEKKRSILCEQGITMEVAKDICKKRGFLSPRYETNSRDGCVLCPNAKDHEIAEWLRDYPSALPILDDLERRVKEERPELQAPRRGFKWFIE